jgi:hypothetical protein
MADSGLQIDESLQPEHGMRGWKQAPLNLPSGNDPTIFNLNSSF